MADATSMCILLVEDSPQDAFLLRTRLSRLVDGKLELLHAERLGEALALLRQHPVDLVLTDLSLPDSLGVDTVRALVEQAGGVPVVVLFGCSTPEIAEQLTGAGAWGHISKDRLNSPALAEIVQAAAERKQAGK